VDQRRHAHHVVLPLHDDLTHDHFRPGALHTTDWVR
jgi:hypothetical protein